jgi:hypothetical protein
MVADVLAQNQRPVHELILSLEVASSKIDMVYNVPVQKSQKRTYITSKFRIRKIANLTGFTLTSASSALAKLLFCRGSLHTLSASSEHEKLQINLSLIPILKKLSLLLHTVDYIIIKLRHLIRLAVHQDPGDGEVIVVVAQDNQDVEQELLTVAVHDLAGVVLESI